MKIKVKDLMSYLSNYDPDKEIVFKVGADVYEYGYISEYQTKNVVAIAAYIPTGPGSDAA
jgi:hypothetical protein